MEIVFTVSSGHTVKSVFVLVSSANVLKFLKINAKIIYKKSCFMGNLSKLSEFSKKDKSANGVRKINLIKGKQVMHKLSKLLNFKKKKKT